MPGFGEGIVEQLDAWMPSDAIWFTMHRHDDDGHWHVWSLGDRVDPETVREHTA